VISDKEKDRAACAQNSNTADNKRNARNIIFAMKCKERENGVAKSRRPSRPNIYRILNAILPRLYQTTLRRLLQRSKLFYLGNL